MTAEGPVEEAANMEGNNPAVERPSEGDHRCVARTTSSFRGATCRITVACIIVTDVRSGQFRGIAVA
jgi:hypothetical protein